ncbi:MAG: serine hydrolase domain-containing protein [Acidimicrobiales bacterium]
MSAPADVTHLLADWPDPTAASIALVDGADVVATGGVIARVSRIASISKVIAALAVLIAAEEGTVDLDEPAGPPGATVRHLLAHASGLDFDEHRSIAAVGKRRIYSNAGIEQLADHLAARAAMPFEQYQAEAVLGPLGMADTVLRGSPAHSVWSNVADLTRLARELLAPTLIAAETLAEATTVQFGDLAGVIPGLGRFDPAPWGLGFELKGAKSPHWTAPANDASTFGHFGGTGTFLWVDPTLGLAAVAISGTDYGPWALDVWPPTSQALIDLAR